MTTIRLATWSLTLAFDRLDNSSNDQSVFKKPMPLKDWIQPFPKEGTQKEVANKKRRR